jgi:hypothetical protein
LEALMRRYADTPMSLADACLVRLSELHSDCQVFTLDADVFINMTVPYWADTLGHIVTPGDTKAEENAWNSKLLASAQAMMPHHPNVGKWRQKACFASIGAVSLAGQYLRKPLRSDGHTGFERKLPRIPSSASDAIFLVGTAAGRLRCPAAL